MDLTHNIVWANDIIATKIRKRITTLYLSSHPLDLSQKKNKSFLSLV